METYERPTVLALGDYPVNCRLRCLNAVRPFKGEPYHACLVVANQSRDVVLIADNLSWGNLKCLSPGGVPIVHELKPHSYQQVAAKRGGIKAMAEGAEKEARQAVEKTKASVRAFVEHPFHIVKNLFHHRKVRYRGLAKNGHQLYTLFGLAYVVIAGRTIGA